MIARLASSCPCLLAMAITASACGGAPPTADTPATLGRGDAALLGSAAPFAATPLAPTHLPPPVDDDRPVIEPIAAFNTRQPAALPTSAAAPAARTTAPLTSDPAPQPFAPYDVLGQRRVERVRITTFDGIELGAQLFSPDAKRFPGPRPAVIFANSWLLNEFEYDVQARIFAARGYVVLAYATRGFGTSEGLVNVAGPDDLRDVSAVIDWLQEHADVAPGAIGMAGVSYGGGIALMAAAFDERISAVVAMSGWGDLAKSLYGNDTVRTVWLGILVQTGRIFGRLHPDIKLQLDRLAQNRDIDKVLAWAAVRSPRTYVEAINQRQVPVFLANSYQDNLFPPAQLRGFYDQLTGPKRFYMDPGIHASSALPGLIGLPTAAWTETQAWFDQWLAGVSGELDGLPPVSFSGPRGREYFDDFPAIVSSTPDLTITPLNSLSRLKPALAAQANLAPTADDASAAVPDASDFIEISSARDSGATSGFPLAAEIADGIFGRPVKQLMLGIDRRFAAVYRTRVWWQTRHLRGAPRVSMYLRAHTAPLQLVAYLYDVDALGVGTLISHGVLTRRSGRSTPSNVSIDLAMTAYDTAPGHRLVLAVDTQDPLYAAATKTPYRLGTHQGAPTITSLALPLVD